MHPWLWFWAPQIHFPWSGAVAQAIEPNTTWFSDLIQPGAGNARIEQQAFDIASYGKQLGLITDVLLDLVQRDAPASARGRDALEKLRQVRDDIDALKATEYKASADALAVQIEALQARGGAEYAAFVRRIAALLPLSLPALPSLPDAAP